MNNIQFDIINFDVPSMYRISGIRQFNYIYVCYCKNNVNIYTIVFLNVFVFNFLPPVCILPYNRMVLYYRYINTQHIYSHYQLASKHFSFEYIIIIIFHSFWFYFIIIAF
jgi:hypothetical protein